MATLIGGMNATPAVAAGQRARRATVAISAQDLRALRGEIEELRTEVQQLRAEQHTTQVQAQQAQAQAQSAATDAQASQSQVQVATAAVPHQIDTALASRPHPTAQWFDSTTLSGRMYYNISSVHREVNGVGTESDVGLLIKRFYLGVDHRFNNVFSASVTADVDSVGATNGALVGRGFYIKKAFLQVRLDPALTIQIGSSDLPWVPYSEGIYGYRYIEQTLIDRVKFGTSADWGIHLSGQLANGLISYAVSAVDGGGYRDPHLTNRVDLEGRVSLRYHGFDAAVGGYSGQLGRNVAGGPATYHTATRLNALLAYRNSRFSVGGEYFWARNWAQVSSPIEDTSDGYSAFASVNVAPRISLFGRYDWVNPHRDTAPTLVEHYFDLGAQFSPYHNIDLSLVYKRDMANNGVINTGNGLIGGTLRGTYDEVGLFGQFRF